MKIHYTLDDSAVRLPLAIRSSEGVWDHAAALRTAPGIQLVELTTQHVLNTGAALVDELAHFFEEDAPSESDPYDLTTCYANRAVLEDLLRDLSEAPLAPLDEIEDLFPPSVEHELNVLLALTVVGVPAFGYVRTYKDSEGEEYHGIVVNLAQARPHLEETLGQFSLSLLIDTIRYGLFNHEIFQLAYGNFCEAIGRTPDRLSDRLKNALMSRGIAWYMGYRHDLAFYDSAQAAPETDLETHVQQWNALVAGVGKKKFADWLVDDLSHAVSESSLASEQCIDVVGYHVARTLAGHYGEGSLRDSVAQGPDTFLSLYNALGEHHLEGIIRT
jgi:hypothetical protein